MKNKFKSFSISLMIVFLLVTISCQVEETIVETENIKNQNDLLIKKISFNEIKNSAVVDKINNTKKLSKKTITTSSKIIKDTLNNFYINSDEGMYIEKTDGTKSYTFSVFRENATDLENLVIIVYPNNQIKTFLVDYNKTFNELNSMSLEQMQNNQIEYYEINFNTNEFIPVFQNNSNGRYICETIMFWDTIPCYEGDLVGAGQGIDCWGWVIIGHTCWEGGSGGGEGFGFDSDFGTNGNGSPTGGGGSTGSGSSGSSSNQIITTPTTSLESEQEAQALIKRQKNFTTNLSWNQNAWLNNNQEAENNIYEYLESQVTDPLATEYSAESVAFAEWAINYLTQHPTTTWQQFQNWFIGRSEGRDFEYDEQYWENPNLTFPQQNLPTYNAFFNAYPKNQDGSWMVGADNVYAYVGGQVQQARINYPNDTNNTCALKVSIALNGAGITIPSIPGQTLQGDGQFANQYFFLNARALNIWMRKTFGTTSNPNYITIPASQITLNGENLPTLLSNIKGIYSLVCPLGSTWASGHADIIDNTLCAANCHFYDAPIEYIDIWKLN